MDLIRTAYFTQGPSDGKLSTFTPLFALHYFANKFRLPGTNAVGQHLILTPRTKSCLEKIIPKTRGSSAGCDFLLLVKSPFPLKHRLRHPSALGTTYPFAGGKRTLTESLKTVSAAHQTLLPKKYYTEYSLLDPGIGRISGVNTAAPKRSPPLAPSGIRLDPPSKAKNWCHFLPASEGSDVDNFTIPETGAPLKIRLRQTRAMAYSIRVKLSTAGFRRGGVSARILHLQNVSRTRGPTSVHGDDIVWVRRPDRISRRSGFLPKGYGFGFHAASRHRSSLREDGRLRLVSFAKPKRTGRFP